MNIAEEKEQLQNRLKRLKRIVENYNQRIERVQTRLNNIK